jgi:hypothetical protein
MVVIELAAEDEEKQEVEDEKRNEEQEEEGRSGDGTTSRTTDSSVAEVASDKRGEKENLDAKTTAEIEASTDPSSKPGKSSSTADLTSARAGKEPESDLHKEYI